MEGLPLRGGEVGAQQDLHRRRAGQRRERLREVLACVKIVRPLEGPRRALAMRHAVEAQRAKAFPQVAVPHDVPAAGAEHEAVDVEVAGGERAVRRPVAQGRGAPRLRRLAQHQQQARVGVHPGIAHLQGNAFAHGGQRFLRRGGENPVEFRLHAFDGGRGVREAQPARGDQAERERLRLLAREHHRGQLVAGHEAVAAVAALLRGDGDAHLLQHRDVAPERARVDLHPPGELRPAQLAVGLEQLEDREDAQGGFRHTPTLYRN